MSANLPARRQAGVARSAPRAVLAPGTGQNVVPGSSGVPILTVVVTHYGGHSREEAAEQVWGTWQRRFPRALIQVVHSDEGWEPLR